MKGNNGRFWRQTIFLFSKWKRFQLGKHGDKDLEHDNAKHEDYTIDFIDKGSLQYRAVLVITWLCRTTFQL